MNRLHNEPSSDLNFIIVTHGLTSRVFLMKWFKWTVEQFEGLNNLGNCEFQVMQLGNGGEYSLAIHHTEEEMIKWGLSHEMIADQKWRAHAHRGDWNEKCSWYLDSFFENLQESDSSDEEENDELNGPIPLYKCAQTTPEFGYDSLYSLSDMICRQYANWRWEILINIGFDLEASLENIPFGLSLEQYM